MKVPSGFIVLYFFIYKLRSELFLSSSQEDLLHPSDHLLSVYTLYKNLISEK